MGNQPRLKLWGLQFLTASPVHPFDRFFNGAVYETLYPPPEKAARIGFFQIGIYPFDDNWKFGPLWNAIRQGTQASGTGTTAGTHSGSQPGALTCRV